MSFPRPRRDTLGRARSLRRRMTDAELILWAELRHDALGVRFRRQHPVGAYIADFACVPSMLIVEVDGATHSTPAEMAHDARRTAYLEKCGWAVLRFTNEDIYEDVDAVVDVIAGALRCPR